MSRDSLEIGDETLTIITDPNADNSRDPVCQVDGKVTFVRFQDDYRPEFGESVRVRMADFSEGHNVAIAVGDYAE